MFGSDAPVQLKAVTVRLQLVRRMPGFIDTTFGDVDLRT